MREHLMLYARIRGASSREINGWIQEAAELVKLDGDAFERCASGLSGGMKRRLSIALALVGMPRVILMDEPTTGIDPENRHQIWKIIDEIRRDKSTTLIFTTHLMEEADNLADRIGILAEGNLQCIGTQIHLKRKFGEGFRISCIFSITAPTAPATSPNVLPENAMQTHEQKCISGVTDILASALGIRDVEVDRNRSRTQIEVKRGGVDVPLYECTWKLHTSFLLKSLKVGVSEIFDTLETKAAALGISEWGISAATMDDVFVRLSGQL